MVLGALGGAVAYFFAPSAPGLKQQILESPSYQYVKKVVSDALDLGYAKNNIPSSSRSHIGHLLQTRQAFAQDPALTEVQAAPDIESRLNSYAGVEKDNTATNVSVDVNGTVVDFVATFNKTGGPDQAIFYVGEGTSSDELAAAVNAAGIYNPVHMMRAGTEQEVQDGVDAIVQDLYKLDNFSVEGGSGKATVSWGPLPVDVHHVNIYVAPINGDNYGAWTLKKSTDDNQQRSTNVTLPQGTYGVVAVAVYNNGSEGQLPNILEVVVNPASSGGGGGGSSGTVSNSGGEGSGGGGCFLNTITSKHGHSRKQFRGNSRVRQRR